MSKESVNGDAVHLEDPTATTSKDNSIKQPFDVDENGYREILSDHPVNNMSWNRIRIYITCFFIYLCSTMNGFDGSLMTSINTMNEYTTYFHQKNSASGQGLVFSIYQAGQICATAFIWLADYIGRVYTIFGGVVIVCIGAIMSATCHQISVFIGARFLLAFGCGLATAVCPMYLVEICPPELRSTLSAVYNSFYYIGSIIATWSIYGTSITYKGQSLSFRIPLWLQLLCPGMVALTILFIAPESPRYLYLKGKREKARQFFIKYHANDDEDHPLVEYQISEMEESFLEVPKFSIRDYFDFRKLFSSKSRTYRSMLVIAWSWFGQFSGNTVVTYYITTIFLDLGVKNATTRLLLSAVESIIAYISATCGSLVVDRLGRRPVMLTCTASFVVCFAIIAGCLAGFINTGNKKAGSAGIAFIYLYGGVCFPFGYTPLQPLYPAEVLSSEMRARGMALFQLTQGVAAFVNTYSAPTAMQNIRYWYYVFFVFWDLFEFFIIYFFFVETKQLTLEEIEKLFLADKPVKESIEVAERRKAEIKRLASANV
ncbi:DEKNAAC103170 [Brettanomyces naardenensis]|uniref:DEKNAAC103170 n=1 Tax=Brettanomyces naardenensis TaxID=13370 RepID=A0A448YMS6_BRENA|nr:DEKNAAC103170 [Brettanomyces naardenensis]